MDTSIRSFLKSLYRLCSSLTIQLDNRAPYERLCDKCGKRYAMNSEKIPRITVKKKVLINDLTAKEALANPDLCENCVNIIIDMLQTLRRLRFNISNPAMNNYAYSRE